MANKTKKSFNVVLNSSDTTSWSGNHQSKCTFRINPRGILDTEDYGKDYKVYMAMQQAQGTPAEANYAMSLDIAGCRIQHVQAVGSTISNTHFILNMQNNGALQTSKKSIIEPYDQGPIIVKNLTKLDYIRVSFIAGSSGSQAYLENYILIFRFEEI